MKGTERENEEDPLMNEKVRKIPTDNLSVKDIFRIKHELDLKDETICKLFDI